MRQEYLFLCLVEGMCSQASEAALSVVTDLIYFKQTVKVRVVAPCND